MILLVCLNALETVSRSHWCEAEQGKEELPAVRCTVCQSPASLPNTTAQLKFKVVIGKKTNHHDSSQKTNKSHSSLITAKSSPFNRLFSCLWMPQIAPRRGRRPANDTRGGPRYCLAGKLPVTLQTDTFPSTVPTPKAEPDSTQQPCGGMYAAPWEVSGKSTHGDARLRRQLAHENWPNSPPPSAVSHIAYQTGKGTCKPTPATAVTLLSTRRISHLITASSLGTERRLFHPELNFYPPHSKSFFMHILLRAASSPSMYKYTHTYIHMTIKHFLITQRNPMRLTDCPHPGIGI